MLFEILISAHGLITTPTPREILGGDKQLAINNGELFKALAKTNTAPAAPALQGTGTGVKSEADILANLATLGTTFPGVLPCRYNPTWKGGNVFTSGANKITWTISAPHPGTCIFRLLKKNAQPVVLGKPFLCSQQTGGSGADPNNSGAGANGGNMDVTLPAGTNCSAADECSIQWFWNADQSDQQYLNCVDFTIGDGLSTLANTTAPPLSTPPPSATSPTFVPVSSSASPIVPSRRCKARY